MAKGYSIKKKKKGWENWDIEGDTYAQQKEEGLLIAYETAKLGEVERDSKGRQETVEKNGDQTQVSEEDEKSLEGEGILIKDMEKGWEREVIARGRLYS